MSIFTVSSVQNDIKKEEQVVFNVPKEIPSENDLTIQYALRKSGTPLDWIGIFQSGVKDTGQPLMFYWAPTKPVDPKDALQRAIEIPASHIQSLDDGSYQFVYVNKEKQTLGISPSFTILKHPIKPDISPVTSDSWADTESHVMISSDEEWQLASPGLSVQELSSSDLSDIVVLSTSPSKESTKRIVLQTGDIHVEDSDHADFNKQNGDLAKIWNIESHTTDQPKRTEPKPNIRKKVTKFKVKEQKHEIRTCLDGSTIVSPVEKKSKKKLPPVDQFDHKGQIDFKDNIEKSKNDAYIKVKSMCNPTYQPACSDEQEIKPAEVVEAGGLTGRKIKKAKRKKKIIRNLTPLISDSVLLSEPFTFSGQLEDTGPDCNCTTQMEGDNASKTEQPLSNATIATPANSKNFTFSEGIENNAAFPPVISKAINVVSSQIEEDKNTCPILDKSRNLSSPAQRKTSNTAPPAGKENNKVIPLALTDVLDKSPLQRREECKTNSLLMEQDDVTPCLKECDTRRDEEHKEQAFNKQRFRNLMSTHRAQAKKNRKQIKNYLKMQPLITEKEEQPVMNTVLVSNLGLTIPSLEDTSEQGFPCLPKRECDDTLTHQSDAIDETISSSAPKVECAPFEETRDKGFTSTKPTAASLKFGFNKVKPPSVTCNMIKSKYQLKKKRKLQEKRKEFLWDPLDEIKNISCTMLTTPTDSEPPTCQVTETQIQSMGTSETSEVQANELETMIQTNGQSTQLTDTTSVTPDHWNFKTETILPRKADKSDTMTNQFDTKPPVSHAPLSYANVVKMNKCNICKENNLETPECLEVGTFKEEQVDKGDCNKQCEDSVQVDTDVTTSIQDNTATIGNTLETKGYSQFFFNAEPVMKLPTPAIHGQNGSADISADSEHDTSSHDCMDDIPSCRETNNHDCGKQWSKTAALKRVARLIRRRARLLVDQQIHRKRETRLENRATLVGNNDEQDQSSTHINELARIHSGKKCPAAWTGSNLLVKSFGNECRPDSSCFINTSHIVDKIPVIPLKGEDTPGRTYTQTNSAAQVLPSRLALNKRKGQMVKTLRTQAEILALKSLLKANCMEIQSLHHQLNVLKALLYTKGQEREYNVQLVEKGEDDEFLYKSPPRKKIKLSDDKDCRLWSPDINKLDFVPEVKKRCSSGSVNVRDMMFKPFSVDFSTHDVHEDNSVCMQRSVRNEEKTTNTDVLNEGPRSDLHRQKIPCCKQVFYMDTSSQVPHHGCKTSVLCPGGIYCQSSQVDNILTDCHESPFCWSAWTQTEIPASQAGHCCSRLSNAPKPMRDNASDMGHSFSLSVLGKYAACSRSTAKTFQYKDCQNVESTAAEVRNSPTYKETRYDVTRNEASRPANCLDTSHFQSCFMKELVRRERMKQAHNEKKEGEHSDWLRRKDLVDRMRPESENVNVDKLPYPKALDCSYTLDSADDPDHSFYWNHSAEPNALPDKSNVSVNYMPNKKLLLKVHDTSDREREIQWETNSSLHYYRRLIEALEAKKRAKQ